MRERSKKCSSKSKGRSSLPLLLDFPTTRAQSASKAVFFSFFFVAHLGVMVVEDIFSTLLLSQEDKIFMRRFLRSPHLGSSSTGVYLLLNTYISTKGKRKRTHQHARTHARPLAARVVRHDDDDDEKKKKKLSSALSRRQTQTGHLAIRGTGETAKREQVFPGLTRNRG